MPGQFCRGFIVPGGSGVVMKSMINALVHVKFVVNIIFFQCFFVNCNALVKWYMNKHWFVWLSAFSFMIYVLHAPLIVYATRTVFIQISDWYGYRMITFIFLPLCLIALSVVNLLAYFTMVTYPVIGSLPKPGSMI